MKIGIIGAGKVGCALAIGLKQCGYTISGVYSKNHKSVELLNETLGEAFENILFVTVKHSDVLFITVPDKNIQSIVKEICKKQSIDLCKKVFFHCSGAVSSAVLNALAEKGCYTASFHPIQTFAEKKDGWKGLYNIYFGFEGSKEAESCAERIVQSLSGKILHINEKDKPIYHAAACMLSNYTVALAYVVEGLLKKIGIDAETGIKAFAPLIIKTVENITADGSVNALTGPVSRGDTSVIEGHIDALKKLDTKALDIYRVLGKVTIDAALCKKSINNETAEILYNKLGERL